ncbi:DNA mismatch endonuclease Vsr [Pusillimonas noertemannii]|nr:DNA mismatch endonuclease Vsr [Pusillimonas noertemannii]TFL11101.1 DNA mismatch endonuclease Vsr [Pusillimonas noertemannii]
MTDTISVSERSRVMALIKSKNTGPEMLIRRLVHGAGYRYRLHGAKLPGKPDLVFSGRRKVIFVHGCFWHWHAHCVLSRMPKSNEDFWAAKLEGNRARDSANCRRLHEMGWDTMVIWECELRDLNAVLQRITRFLDPPAQSPLIPQ